MISLLWGAGTNGPRLFPWCAPLSAPDFDTPRTLKPSASDPRVFGHGVETNCTSHSRAGKASPKSSAFSVLEEPQNELCALTTSQFTEKCLNPSNNAYSIQFLKRDVRISALGVVEDWPQC